MDQPAPQDRLAAPRVHPRGVGEAARRHAADARPATTSTRLRSLNDPISLDEVVEIYLPLSRLLSLYVAATQALHEATRTFLGTTRRRDAVHHRPSPARSRSASRRRRACCARCSRRWPNTPKVELDRHRRLPAAQRGAGARRPDGAQGLPGELRPAGAARLPQRHQGGQAPRRARRSTRTSPTTSCPARRSPSTGRTS